MDYFGYLALVLFGLLIGRYWGLWGAGAEPPVPTIVTRSVIPSTGPDTVYARFHYYDGRVEVKKFKATDLAMQMEWKNRLFEAEKWTPDGQVYKEVLNGR